MLGTKLTEQKAEKVVRKVKAEKDVEQEKVETVDLEQEEVSSAAMVLKVIMDRAEKTAEKQESNCGFRGDRNGRPEQVWR